MGNQAVFSSRDESSDFSGLLAHEIKELLAKFSLSELIMQMPDGSVVPVKSAVQVQSDADGDYQIMFVSELPSFVPKSKEWDFDYNKTVMRVDDPYLLEVREPKTVYGVVCTTERDGQTWFKKMYPRLHADLNALVFYITNAADANVFREDHPDAVYFWTYKAQNARRSPDMREIADILNNRQSDVTREETKHAFERAIYKSDICKICGGSEFDLAIHDEEAALAKKLELGGQPSIRSESVTNVMFVVSVDRLDGLRYAKSKLNHAYLEDTATTVVVVEDSTKLEALYNLVRDDQRIDLVWTKDAIDKFTGDWNEWHVGWSDLNVDMDSHNARLMHSVDQVILGRLAFDLALEKGAPSQPNILVALDWDDYSKWNAESGAAVPPFVVTGQRDAMQLVDRLKKQPSFTAKIEWTEKATNALNKGVRQAEFVNLLLTGEFQKPATVK